MDSAGGEPCEPLDKGKVELQYTCGESDQDGVVEGVAATASTEPELQQGEWDKVIDFECNEELAFMSALEPQEDIMQQGQGFEEVEVEYDQNTFFMSALEFREDEEIQKSPQEGEVVECDEAPFFMSALDIQENKVPEVESDKKKISERIVESAVSEFVFIPPLPHPRFQRKAKQAALHDVLKQLMKQNGAWAFFEGEKRVLAHLFELSQLLTVLDNDTIKSVARYDNYKHIKNLCLYFSVERRWTVRSEVLNALDLLALKDKCSAAMIISESGFPVDLTKAIVQEYIEDSGNTERILAYLSVLSSLLKTGYRIATHHLDRVDTNFAYCLFQICDGKMLNVTEDVMTAAVEVLLGYNLQYDLKDLYCNPVLAAVANCEGDEAEYFQQKIMDLLLNQQSRNFHNTKVMFHSAWCDMILKFCMDVLSCNQTSGFFMEHDLHLLLAGIAMYVPELEPGDTKRTTALKLCRNVLHRLDQKHPGLRRIVRMLKGIMLEKENESKIDQRIARKIAKEIEESYLNTKF